MASRNELYLSVNSENYKNSKLNVLNIQANILKILRHFQNLKVLSRQKEDLKKRLHKLSSSLISEIGSIQNKMPSPDIPKEIQEKFNKKEESIEEIKPKIKQKKIVVKRDLNKTHDIEEELKEIREKLNSLNS
jgi:chaperonin cofactor prefoldin